MTASPFPHACLEALAQNPRLSSLWTRFPNLLQRDEWPGCEDWQAHAAKLATWPEALRFKPEQRIGQRRRRKLARQKSDPTRPTLRRYESAICEAQEIPTREADLHDYFNALVWLHFPLAKYALHRSTWLSYQTPEQYQEGNRRSLLADALTRFDEGGIAYFARSEDDPAELHSLFQRHDDPDKLRYCTTFADRFAVFGHGLLEAWCLGGRDFTASLLIVEPLESGSSGSQDEALAARLKSIKNPRGQFGTMPFDAWLNH